MSFGEMLVLGVVAIVVVGPRNLPSMLRNAGQLIGRLRKMAADIRAESGIDEILEVEGIRSELDHFRKLATGQIDPDEPLVVPDREREYPRMGPDVFGAESEDVDPYTELALSGGVAAEPIASVDAPAPPPATAPPLAATAPPAGTSTEDATNGADSAHETAATIVATHEPASDVATVAAVDDEVKASS